MSHPESSEFEEISKKISEHSYEKHIINSKQFAKSKLNHPNHPGYSKTIGSRDEHSAHINGVLSGKDTEFTAGRGDRFLAYDRESNTAVVYNPSVPHRGTCYRPKAKENCMDSYRAAEYSGDRNPDKSYTEVSGIGYDNFIVNYAKAVQDKRDFEQEAPSNVPASDQSEQNESVDEAGQKPTHEVAPSERPNVGTAKENEIDQQNERQRNAADSSEQHFVKREASKASDNNVEASDAITQGQTKTDKQQAKSDMKRPDSDEWSEGKSKQSGVFSPKVGRTK